MKLLMLVFVVVLQYVSLAVCALGRPQPSDMDSVEESAIGAVTGPFRRFLRGKGGRSSGARIVGGGSGGGNFSTKEIIIIVCSIVGFFLLLIAFKIWHVRKLKKNPDWKFVDCFKRKKAVDSENPAAAEKSATDEKRFVLK